MRKLSCGTPCSRVGRLGGDDLYSCGPEYPLIDYLAPDGTLFFGEPKIPETINPRMDALLAMLLPFFVFGIVETGAAVLGDLLG